MTFASNGAPVVIVGADEVIDPARILPLAPELTKPEWVLTYAALVNHLAQGARFEPIYDPEAFMAAYIARYQGEVPEDEPRPGVTRLHDFGLPDFAAITPPRKIGRAHVCTPVTNAHIVCSLLLEKKI